MSKCCFYTAHGCSATKYADCPEKCKFYKTKEEYAAGVARAKELLAAKGLEPCIACGDGKQIMTTYVMGDA